MGASNLNIRTFYPLFAVLAALALMLTPLIALAGLKPEKNEFLESIPKSFQSLEGTPYGSKVPESPIRDIEALIVSAFIAWGVYLFFKRKSPRKKYRFMGPYPF